jgi:hypothetical protein
MDIPDFQIAVEQFREFLVRHDVRTPITWVFRDDLCPRTSGHLLVRYPPPAENEHLAEKVFSEGKRKGLVEITAVASSDLLTAATVWFPRTPQDEVQGWSNGMKLSIIQPLPVVDPITFGFTWQMVQWSSVYRRYQKNSPFVGTRAWAGV